MDLQPHKSKKRLSSECSSSSSSNVDPAALDGGWGWVVLTASFVTHLIADGCAFTVGVFYAELLDYFGESKSKTSWVGSLFVGVPLLAGPFACALTNKYGCRPVAIVGSLLSATGAILSAFAPNIDVLCFTYGIVSGLGLSMLYVPAVIMPAFYFKRFRALGTGIAVSGSGIGTFIFAPLTEYLIDEYGWRGTMAILAGTMLNMCACGMVFRPLPKKKQSEFLSSEDEVPSRDMISSGNIPKILVTSPATPMEQNGNVLSAQPLEDGQHNANTSTTNRLESSKCDVHVLSEQSDTFNGTNEVNAYICLTVSSPCIDVNRETCPQIAKSLTHVQMSGRDGHSKHSNEVCLTKKDVLFMKNACAIGSYKSLSCPNLHRSHGHLNQKTIPGSLGSGERNKQSLLSKLSAEVRAVVRETFNFSQLQNKIFLLFFLSNAILYMWYDIPYMYITDFAKQMGISEKDGSFLLSTFGIVSTIGQLMYGFLGDRQAVNLILLYAVSILICGGSTLLVPSCTSYLTLAFYCATFGFFLSANYALETIALVELLGLEELTTAYGIVMLGQGAANMIGPPIAGKLSDITEDYDAAFYTAGSLIIVSSLLIFLILPLRRTKGTCDPNTRLETDSPDNETRI